MGEEWTDSDADTVTEIFKYFGGSTEGLVSAEKAPPAGQVAEALGPTELTEQLLAEYSSVCKMARDLAKIKEDLRYNILKCMGNSENARRGDWIVRVKPRCSVDIDWRGLMEDYSGAKTVEEIEQIVRAVKEKQMVHPRIKLNEGEIVEVMSLGEKNEKE